VKRFKDPAIALSLANLLFLEVWVGILPGSLWHYHLSKPPPAPLYIAVVVDILLLAFLFWIFVFWARRSRSALLLSVVRWTFLYVFIIAIQAVRQQIPGLSDSELERALGKIPLSIIAYILAATSIVLFWKWTDRFVHGMATLLVLLAPFAGLTFFQAGWAVLAPPSAFSDFAETSAPPLNTKNISPRLRIIWFIFDELDQRLTFVRRPDSVKMPELDRLRSQALYASNAYPPAGKTLLSIPALLTGRYVSKATISNSKELLIAFDDATQPESLSSQSNIFSRARRMGLNSAVMGWYHPYCRLIGRSLVTCSIHGGSRWDMPEMTMWEMFPYVVNPGWMPTVWKNIPLLKKLGVKARLHRFYENKSKSVRIRRYVNMLTNAKAVVANPVFDLVFVHWTIPHPVGIYNRTKKELAWDGGKQTYLDNLELVDKTIGELRHSMERAGMWQTSTLIISSDHAFRTFLWPLATEERKAVEGQFDARVPFLIKLAGQQRSIVYERTLNTVVTHDLILALLESRIKDPENLVEWLDKHRPAKPPPDEKANLAASDDSDNETDWQ